jgi:hypothetical protein
MLMDEGATASEIASYLYSVATEHMGLTGHGLLAGKSERIAQLLVQLQPEFGTPEAPETWLSRQGNARILADC